MFPILFQIGGLTVQSYGVFAALGFCAALATSLVLGKKEGFKLVDILDLTFFCTLLGLVGARILFVITIWSDFRNDLAGIFRIWEGGFVFFGGLILSFFFAYIFSKAKKMDPWRLSDVAMPALTIGHAIGRLGCFMAGCCHGAPTSSFFGVKFSSDLVEPDLRNLWLHPTQIYESLALVLLFVFLLILSRRKKFHGQVGIAYFLVYPVIRFVVEILRGDSIRGHFLGTPLSTSQGISVLVLLAALLVLFWKGRHRKVIGIFFIGIFLSQRTYGTQRIIPLTPALAEIVLDLEEGKFERIVGVTDLTDLPSEKKIPRIGPYHRFSVERVLSLKPTLLIATKDGNLKSQIEIMEKHKIKVVSISSHSLREIADSYRVVGEAIGKSERGNQLADAFEAAVERFRDAQREKKKIFLALSTDPIITAGAKTFLSELFSLGGGQNIATTGSDSYPRIGVESVIAWGPERIFHFEMSPDQSPNQDGAKFWKTRRITAAVTRLDPGLYLRPTRKLADRIIEIRKSLQ